MESKGAELRALATSNIAQTLFAGLFVAVLGLIAWLLRDYGAAVHHLKASNPSYPWPAYSDLLIGVACGLSLFGILRILRRLLPPFCDRHLKADFVGAERTERLHRHIGFLFRGCYFMLAASVGFWSLRDADFLPPCMGGGGSAKEAFAGYPYKSTSDHPYTRYYLLLELGYQVCNTLDHLVDKPKKDFIEMSLHHILAVALISLSYCLNFIPMTALIVLRSAFTDVSLNFLRGTVDLRYPRLTKSLFVVFLGKWVYARVYVTFWYLLWEGVNNEVFLRAYGAPILLSMLLVMIALECYWLVLLVKVAIGLVTTGEIKDIMKTDISETKTKAN